MKNIFAILKRDLSWIRRSTMTIVVLLGLVAIPSLFSTFNSLASWDPFSNTENLKIAVASTDEGYETDVVKLHINLGDQVLSQLSRNDQIDWVITNEDQAIEGTKSGEYYAAIVLPPTFSSDLLTFYVEGTEPSTLAVYTNEKKNALAPVITAQGAQGVISQINTGFATVVNSVGLELVSSLDDYLHDEGTQDALNRIEARVSGVGDQLTSAAQSVRSLGNLTESTLPLVEGAQRIADAAGSQFDDPSSELGGGSGDAANLDAVLGDTASSLEAGLQATSESYSVVGDRIDELFNNAQATSASTAQTFTTLADRVGQQTESLQALRNTMESTVGGVLPEPARPGYERALGNVDAAIESSQQLSDNFRSTADDISAGNASAQDSRAQSRDAINQARQAVDSAVTSYRENLRPQIEQLGASLGALGDSVDEVKADLGRVRESIDNSPGSLTETITRASATTNGIADKLYEHAQTFHDLEQELANAADSGDLSRIAEMIGSDPEVLASHLASPVSVDRQPVFPVAAFGAGMAPLYTALALWIGALLSAVMIRTDVDGSAEKIEHDPGEAGDDADEADADGATKQFPVVPSRAAATPVSASAYSRTEAYFGRFATFALIGLAQSTLVVLGLLVFVQVQAEHPLLLFVCAWLSSLVFMLIAYTMVVSFGSVGKALSVLLLIIHVSGAGGAYPLPLLPEGFQRVSPLLPATYTVEAMRAAIAGVYRGDFWIYLGKLALFIIPVLILGLVVRRLFEGFKHQTAQAMDSTKVMAP